MQTPFLCKSCCKNSWVNDNYFLLLIMILLVNVIEKLVFSAYQCNLHYIYNICNIISSFFSCLKLILTVNSFYDVREIDAHAVVSYQKESGVEA